MPIVNVHEIKIQTTGFPGAPGWTTFYFDGDDPTNRANQFRQAKVFLMNVRGSFPVTWSGRVLAEGRLLLAATGFVQEFTAAPLDGTADPVVGTSPGGFGAGVAGLCIGWRTPGLNRGRRVHGRTFLVPLAAPVYDADGTMDPLGLADMETFADAWSIDPAGFGIYSRPRLGVGGAFFRATSAAVQDKAAYLSSRRD